MRQRRDNISLKGSNFPCSGMPRARGCAGMHFARHSDTTHVCRAPGEYIGRVGHSCIEGINRSQSPSRRVDPCRAIGADLQLKADFKVAIASRATIMCAMDELHPGHQRLCVRPHNAGGLPRIGNVITSAVEVELTDYGTIIQDGGSHAIGVGRAGCVPSPPIRDAA